MTSQHENASETRHEPPSFRTKSHLNRSPLLSSGIVWTVLVLGVSAVQIESQIHYEIIGVSTGFPEPDIHAEFGTATIPMIAFVVGLAVLAADWVASTDSLGFRRRAR
jgi:hypothetical protein